MSHNHPFRSSRTDYRSRDDFYEDTGSQYTGQRDFYPPPQDLSRIPPHQPPSRAMETHTPMRPEVMSILDSCGLDPSDLSLLAELPEDLINIETLPHLLKKLWDSKKLKPETPGSTSHFITSAPAPAYERRRLSSPPQRPDCSPHSTPTSSRDLMRETWRDHDVDQRRASISAHHSRQRGASGSHVVEYGHPRHEDLHHNHPAAYGSEPRQGPISSSSRRDIDYRHKSLTVDSGSSHLSQKDNTHHTLPSKKEASDFHGSTPPCFPYACELCHIAVLSNKDWTQHINAAQHADSQLKLLQRYPKWDCHVSSYRKEDDRPPERPTVPDKAKKEKNTKTQKRSGQPTGEPSNKRPNLKKVPEKPKTGGKVISVRFTAKSIDEDYLRRLLGQFGAIIKIIMFPSLAFVEMGSEDQAGDIEKYFTSNPLEAEGSKVVFAISEAFNFLKSSKVVCFSPLPAGDGVTSEITAAARQFGPLKEMLFLPSRAYIEMTEAAHAEALVKHHASKPLKLKGSTIQVNFSSEYETLEKASSERSSKDRSPKRHTRRSPSPAKSHSPSRRRRHRSKSRSRSPRRRSRDEKDGKKRAHSSQIVSGSDEKPVKLKGKPDDKPSEPVPQKNPEEKVSTDAQGKSEEEKMMSETIHDSDSDLEGVAVIAEDDEMEGVEILNAVDSDECEGREDDEDKEQVATRESGQEQEEEAVASIPEEAADEAKLEGAEEPITSKSLSGDSQSEEVGVCEEATNSGASRGEDDLKVQDTAEPPKQTNVDPEPSTPSQNDAVASVPSAGGEGDVDSCEEQGEGTAEDVEDAAQDAEEMPQDMKDGAQDIQEESNDEEEFDFPESLENLITLDELDDEDSSEEQDAKKTETSGQVSEERVICVRDLPMLYYTDEEFWNIGKRYGNVTRYILNRNKGKGFIEMENSEDAKKAVSALTRRRFTLRGYPLMIALSNKYKSLVNAWVPEHKHNETQTDKHKLDSSKSSRNKDRSRSRSHSKSKSQSKRSSSKSKDEKSDQSKSKAREDSEVSAEKSRDKSDQKKSPSKGSSKTSGKENDQSKNKTREDSEVSAEKSRDKSDQKKSPSKGSSKTPGKDEKSDQSKNKTREDSEDSSEKSRDKSDQKKSPSKGSSKTSDKESKSAVNEESGSVEKVAANKGGIEAGPAITVKQEENSLGEYQPNNPVGQEFVRPVVGYFCNLCNVIYTTEEEAKNQHCSSLSHFQKLKEHLEQQKS